MYQLAYISCKNFMSFSDMEFFVSDKCYVIKGENKDDKGQQSNGSGKTSFLEIIAITLLGQSLTDRDLKSCVNKYGAENYFITSLTLVNEQDSVVQISRKVYNNTNSQELTITVNGEALKDVPSKAKIKNGVDFRKGNEWILNSLLCISKEDLLNYYLISDNHYKGFLSSSNQEKINVISRFSNITKIDKVIEKINKEFKVIEQDLVNFQNSISSLKGKIEGIQYSASEEARQRFEEDKQKRKENLLPRSRKVQEQLLELLFVVKSKEEALSLDNILSQEELKEINKEKDELRTLHSDLIDLIGTVKHQLLGEIKCPSCHHVFIVDSIDSVETLKENLKQSEEDETIIVSNIKDLDLLLDQSKETNKLSSEVSYLKRTVQTLEIEFDSLKTQLNSIESESFITNDVTEKLLEFETKILDKEQEIGIRQDLQSKLKLWEDRFERFKYYLINKPIDIICNQTNQMLREIGCDYSIEIEGFRKLKSGELRAELNPVVNINGLEAQPYSQFSTGERTRLDIACDLAIQNMINSTSRGGLNFYFSDEKISGLDSLGVELVAKSFDKINKSMFLISHSGSDLNYKNVITLRKENKQTVIV